MWLFQWIINTIESCVDEGAFFSFMPESYLIVTPLLLDALLDFCFHDIQEQYDLSDMFFNMQKTAELFSNLVIDSRIILAACKDSTLQVLGRLVCHKQGVQALESIKETSQANLIRALLKPYENRAWGQSNWLLLRFWLGYGFANRESRPPARLSTTTKLGLKRKRTKSSSNTGLLHLIAPAYPSIHYQALVAQILREDSEYTRKFVGSLLGQLDWAFSEFIQILQEIQTLLNKEDALDTSIDLKQQKICAMCFELTVSLLRTLEMIMHLLQPELFVEFLPEIDGNDLLNKICELLIQILNRTTIPISCFQFVLDAHLPELQHVTHFPILSVTAGILIVLMRDELSSNDVVILKVSRILLTDTNFHIACLEFMVGQSEMPPSLQNLPRGNFDPNLGRTNIVVAAHSEAETEYSFEVSISSKSDTFDKGLTNQHAKFDFRHCKLILLGIYHALTSIFILDESHVNQDEIDQLEKLIQILKTRQSFLSVATVFSEESLCPICCARKTNVTFKPCDHQSCE